MKNLVRMYMREKKSVPTISKEMGISKSALYRRLKKKGIRPSLLIASRKRNRIAVFTVEQDREIAKKYAERMSLNQLSREYGHCVAAVRNALWREKVKMNPRGNSHREFSKIEQKQMVKMYEAGESQNAIAGKFGSSQTTVGRILTRFGIEPWNRPAKAERHGN